MEDEAETLHTCLGHYPLKRYVFLFLSEKNSGCYGNLNFPYTYNGKSGNLQFLPNYWGYLISFLQKFLLSSSLCFIRLLSKLLDLIG